jgi:MFS family permease
LPLYGTELLQGEENPVLEGVLLGVLLASFSAMQFFFAPLWGRVSDRVGRRPILLLGLTGSVVFYTLFGVASDLGLGEARLVGVGIALLFVSRLGAGVAGATIGTAQAVIADSTAPERRARGMALIGAAFGIGFTFGPLLGFASLFLPLPGAPGYLAAGLSLLALLFGLARLPETRRGTPPAGLRRRVFDWQGFLRVLRTPHPRGGRARHHLLPGHLRLRQPGVHPVAGEHHPAHRAGADRRRPPRHARGGPHEPN